jgi:hypothetical protein
MKNGEKRAFGFVDQTFLSEGLTKREYFAAAAMQGICSNPSVWGGQNFAETAVKIADNLLIELAKTEGGQDESK